MKPCVILGGIIYCQWVLVGLIVVEHILQTDMRVRFLPSRPWRVMNDHLPNQWLSSPLCVFIYLMRLSVIITAPPGLYIECHGSLVSTVVTDLHVHYFAILLRNLSFACLFLQCVLVSASIRMLYCWDLLLLQSSLRE